MHPTAYENCEYFYACYGARLPASASIIEIGSQDVNGSLRSIWTKHNYTGVDFVAGKGVDVILEDPYKIPFGDETTDVVLSSSVFEHSEMFWLLFLEIMRILKPHGLFYLNAPSNGEFHRWPVDCYRFYPDSGRGLVAWAKRNDIHAALLESYVSEQGMADRWNDFVAVFVKDDAYIGNYPNRIVDVKPYVMNGLKYGSNEFINLTAMPEDQKRLFAIGQVISRQIRVTP